MTTTSSDTILEESPLRRPYKLFSSELKEIDQVEFTFVIEFVNVDEDTCVY